MDLLTQSLQDKRVLTTVLQGLLSPLLRNIPSVKYLNNDVLMVICNEKIPSFQWYNFNSLSHEVVLNKDLLFSGLSERSDESLES